MESTDYTLCADIQASSQTEHIFRMSKSGNCSLRATAGVGDVYIYTEDTPSSALNDATGTATVDERNGGAWVDGTIAVLVTKPLSGLSTLLSRIGFRSVAG